MYIYNVTINIDETSHSEWLVWIESHVEKTLATGCFSSAKMTQVLVEEEMGGYTYSIQYTAPSREDLDMFYKTYADILNNEAHQKFGNKMLTFKTELKLIKEFYSTVSNN